MDEKYLTEDLNGTKPTDIIGGGLDQAAEEELAPTLERPLGSELLGYRPKHGGSNSRIVVRRHPLALILLALVSVVVVLVLFMAWRRTNNLPGLDMIEQDARERIQAPTYSGGYFGNDDRLIPTTVTVGARQHTDRAPEGAALEETFAATGYVSADVMVSYQNESVIATKTAVLGYAKQNNEWVGAGAVANEQVSFAAIDGVDQRKVLLNIDRLLERASSMVPTDSQQPTLASIYDGATFEVTSSLFDSAAQTDTLTIHARKASLFSAYECDIVATFSFGQSNGLWELVDATVTDDAWTRRFDPIIGTWSGTFKSQEVSSGAKCLAGSRSTFLLTITSWEVSGTGAQITGTITTVAHYHSSPSKNQNSTKGDAVLESVPFTASLANPNGSRTSSEATFVATLPEDVGGKVSITIQFGTGEDGAGVTAVVSTEHQFEDKILLIPYQNQVVYADTYELSRAPEGADKQDNGQATSTTAQKPSTETAPNTKTTDGQQDNKPTSTTTQP